MSDSTNSLQPIKTAPHDRWVLLAGESGYLSTPLRFEAGKYNKAKLRWENHAGYAFSDGGPDPIYWMEIPKEEEEKHSFNEWLQTKEYQGITVLDAFWSPTLLTRKEFERKLLTSRVEISQDRLKQLIQTK